MCLLLSDLSFLSNELLTVSKRRVLFDYYATGCMPNFNAVMVENYATRLSYAAMVQAADSITAPM